MNSTLGLLLAVLWRLSSCAEEVELEPGESGISKCNSSMGSIHRFMVESLDSKNVSMSKYKGYTGQYLDMNPLLNMYNNLGFYITGFPCNQFDMQEPGKNHEILNGIKYVRPGNGFTPASNFHIYGKLKVNGDDAHEMYKFLKEACPSTTKRLGKKSSMFWDVIRISDLWWNFEKFVIDRDGRPLYRIHPSLWDHGNVVKPLLEEAFAIRSSNALQTNSDAGSIWNNNQQVFNGANTVRPLAILG